MSHAERVAANFRPGSAEYETALYHDHIEDGLGPVPKWVRGYVEILTRGDAEDYKAYVQRIKNSGAQVAIQVKLADARDNLARCRGAFDGHVNSNLANRYRYVIRQLGGDHATV